MPSAIETLSQPLKLPSGLVLRNRIVKAAMAEGLGTANNKNRPDETHVNLYSKFSEGNYGLVITGNVQVDPRYMGDAFETTLHTPEDLTSPSVLKQWRSWAAAAQRNDTPAIVQINHVGRQSPANGGYRHWWEKTLAPSAIPLQFPGGWMAELLRRVVFGTPREMTVREIRDVVAKFVDTAVMAEKAGFKGVELHGAHGYLITLFLSPSTNKRTDAYGGTAQKRLKFLQDTIAGIRAATQPGFTLGIKLNSADYQTSGLSESDALSQISSIFAMDVDFVEISGGNWEKPTMLNARDSTRKREAFFLEFSRKVMGVKPKEKVVMLTGGFVSRLGMGEALGSGAADVVGVARCAAVEPTFPRDKVLNEDVEDEEAVLVHNVARWRGMKYRLPVVAAGADSEWHTVQLQRIAQGKEVDLGYVL